MEDCLLASERGNELRERMLAVCRELGLGAYDRRAQIGFLRNLVVREGRRSGQFQVRLVTSPGALDPEPLVEALGDVHSLIWTQAAGVAETTAGGRDELLSGEPKIEEQLSGLRFALSSEAFFQTNTEMAERLYEVAGEYAALRGWERVYDLCCGIGTIGLTLAPRAAEVIGVEIVEEAVEDARANARANEISNARFIAGDVRPVLKDLAEGGDRPDVVVVDPPRAGLSQEGRRADRRSRAEADRLRLLQPDDARAERRAARRGRLRAEARAAGRHVPADAAHRVRRAARTRLTQPVSSSTRRRSASSSSRSARTCASSAAMPPLLGPGPADVARLARRVRGRRGRRRLAVGLCARRVDRLLVVAEQVLPAILLLARATADVAHELALGERIERRVEVVEAGERMHALGALLELAGRLRAAQQQHAQDGLLIDRDPERLVDEMAVLRRAAAAAARVADPAPAAELLQRGAQRRLVVVDDRIAVRRLVAGQSQRVERQRVLIGRRALLLQQAAEHALFGRGEIHSFAI